MYTLGRYYVIEVDGIRWSQCLLAQAWDAASTASAQGHRNLRHPAPSTRRHRSRPTFRLECSKEHIFRFFDFHKVARPRTNIKELADGNRMLRSQEEMTSHALAYYKELYRFDALTEINFRARGECMRNVPRLVTTAQNKELLLPLSSVEFEEALKQLPSGKAAGQDGIPMCRSPEITLAGNWTTHTTFDGGSF